MTSPTTKPPETHARDRRPVRLSLVRAGELLLASSCLALTGVVAAFAFTWPQTDVVELPLPLATEESVAAIEAAVAKRAAAARAAAATRKPTPAQAAESAPAAAADGRAAPPTVASPAPSAMILRLRQNRNSTAFRLWDEDPLLPRPAERERRPTSGSSTPAAPIVVGTTAPPAPATAAPAATRTPPPIAAAPTMIVPAPVPAPAPEAATASAEPTRPPLELPFTLSGHVDAELAGYVEEPRFARQNDRPVQPGIAGELAIARTNDDESRVYARVTGRYDPIDGRRNRVELREAHWSREVEGVELRFGNLQESWGILERENIVDIINQRDIAEDIRGDTKLGQPAVRLSVPLGETVRADAYWLPFFRPRTFTDEDARLGLPFPVRGTDGSYTSARGRKHQDFAGRVQARFGDLELAASHFYGTSRDPRLRIALDPVGRPVALRPEYDLMHQTAVEARAILGPNILKAEAFRRTGPDFAALGDKSFVGIGIGGEREITRILDSDLSLTLFAEYYRDNRKNGQIAPSPLDDDFFVGGRLAFNDFADTTLELSTTVDRKTRATQVTGKLRRRVWENVELGIEADLFTNTGGDPSLQSLGQDSRILGRARVYY